MTLKARSKFKVLRNTEQYLKLVKMVNFVMFILQYFKNHM